MVHITETIMYIMKIRDMNEYTALHYLYVHSHAHRIYAYFRLNFISLNIAKFRTPRGSNAVQSA